MIVNHAHDTADGGPGVLIVDGPYIGGGGLLLAGSSLH